MPNKKQIKLEPTMIVLCDDVRHEANGKQIILGIYTGGINVVVASTDNPATHIVNLAFWMPFKGAEEGVASIELEIAGPNPKHKLKLGANLEFEKTPPPFELSSFTFGVIPIRVDQEGDILISFKNETDADWQLLKTVPVTFIDPNGAANLSGKEPITVTGSVSVDN